MSLRGIVLISSAIVCTLVYGSVAYMVMHKPSLICYDRQGHVTHGSDFKLCIKQ